MALVKENVIDRWFDPKENSWVYRGFKFWFQNPLWDKKLPQGVSLCPYFWISVLGWLLLKPLMYLVLLPIALFFKGIMHVTGGLLKPLDEFLYNSFLGDVESSSYSPGKGLGAGLLLTLFLGLLIGLALLFIALIYGMWVELGTALYRTVCFGTISIGIATLTSIVYTLKHSYKKCKPIFYLVPIMALYMIAIGFISPDLLTVSIHNFFVDWPMTAIKGIGFGLMTAFHYIGVFFAMIFGGVASGFNWSSAVYFLGVPLLLWAFGAFLLMVIVEKRYEKNVQTKRNSFLPKEELVYLFACALKERSWHPCFDRSYFKETMLSYALNDLKVEISSEKNAFKVFNERDLFLDQLIFAFYEKKAKSFLDGLDEIPEITWGEAMAFNRQKEIALLSIALADYSEDTNQFFLTLSGFCKVMNNLQHEHSAMREEVEAFRPEAEKIYDQIALDYAWKDKKAKRLK